VKRPIAEHVTNTFGTVGHKVAVVAIHVVGILGALAFVSRRLYESVRSTKDFWLVVSPSKVN
jgi:hypothetical protein